MAIGEKLLVSGGCIIRPPERKVGLIRGIEIPDATNTLIQLKQKRFASDIYVVLTSAFLREHGPETFGSLRYFSDRKGDYDIVGYDRMIYADGSKQLLEAVCEIGFTHAVMEDIGALVALQEQVTRRFLFAHSCCSDASIALAPSWRDLAEELLHDVD